MIEDYFLHHLIPLTKRVGCKSILSLLNIVPGTLVYKKKINFELLSVSNNEVGLVISVNRTCNTAKVLWSSIPERELTFTLPNITLPTISLPQLSFDLNIKIPPFGVTLSDLP